MSFSRKYLLWLLAPPLALSIPPALLFLSQVVQLTLGSALSLAAMLAVMYGLGCVVFALGVGRHAEAVERALGGQGDLSRAMSECLDRTKLLSVILWIGGG